MPHLHGKPPRFPLVIIPYKSNIAAKNPGPALRIVVNRYQRNTHESGRSRFA